MDAIFAILCLGMGFLSFVFGDAVVDRFRYKDYICKHDAICGCIYAALCTLLAAG